MDLTRAKDIIYIEGVSREEFPFFACVIKNKSSNQKR